MSYTVLTDDDVRRVLPMSAAVDQIESALREHAEGTMVAPPRFRVDVAKGALIFTAGAVTHYDKAVGFRVYDRFQESQASHGQVVVVFDSDTGDFKGVIVGGHLGAMRTGAIGGVAIKHMARPDASHAAILGSGRQARTLLEAAAVVRRFTSVKVYSPNATQPRGICPRDARDARPARCPRWISTRGGRGGRCGHVRHHEHHARVRSQLAQTRRPHQHRRAPSPGRERIGRQHRGESPSCRHRLATPTQELCHTVFPGRYPLDGGHG